MKKTTLFVAALLAAVAAPIAAHAHRAWIAPTATVLSGAGDDVWVGFDAAMSNTLFHADHNAMRIDGLVITAPDGSTVAPANVTRNRYRQTFDLQLTQNGTYRVVNLFDFVFARFNVNGEARTWRGTAADFADAIPAGATDINVTDSANRIETFVTRGAPTPVAQVNTGLALAPITHPNDLVAGEAARFRLLLDGRPAANVEVTIAAGGARYRNEPLEIKVTTAADGSFAVTWPNAGMWWINASVRDLPSQVRNTTRSVQYNGVFEVLP